MNKKQQIEVLKKELHSLENLVVNYQRNASSFPVNYANQSKTFGSSTYYKSARAPFRNIPDIKYKNVNQNHSQLCYKVLPNIPKSNKFTFVANKPKNDLISNNHAKATSFSQFPKCVTTEEKTNSSKDSLNTEKINSALTLFSKTTNQVSKDLTALIQSNLTSQKSSFIQSSHLNSVKTSVDVVKDSSAKFEDNASLLNTAITTSNILQNGNQKQESSNGFCNNISSETQAELSAKLDECCSIKKNTVKHKFIESMSKNSELPSSCLPFVEQAAFQTNSFLKIPRKDKIFVPQSKNGRSLPKGFPTANQMVFLPTNVKEAKNQFKLVNQNMNSLKKLKTAIKHSPRQNTLLIRKPSMPKTKRLLLSKYSIKNVNKSTTSSKSSMVFNQNKNFSSKYRVVNKHLPVTNSTNQDVTKIERTNGTNELDVGKDMECEDKTKIMNQFLNLKINKVKFKSTGSEEFDVLTDFSPDELVAMDTQSLLKLTALLKSSNKNERPIVKKSKYKLVSKRPSLLNKTAKMIKTKYIVKTKSPKSWEKNRMYISSAKRHSDKYRSLWPQKGLNRHVYNIQNRSSFLKLKYARYKKTNLTPHTHYPLSRTKLVRTYRKSLTPQNGKTPLRRSFGSRSVYFNPTLNAAKPQLQSLASRVLHKSIQTAWMSAAKKKETKKNNTYCMFFNRFGKCNRGTNCPYIHDPSKIAVCTKFLRGTCKAKNCPFSHEKSPGKMAICSFFLQGLCTKQDCPYRHEPLKPDAKLCRMFVQGYCSLGTKCEKAHVLICPDHFKGECKKGNLCAYPHPPRRERKNCSEQTQRTKSEDKESSDEVRSTPGSADDLEGDDEAWRYFNIEGIALKAEAKGNVVNDKTDISKSISCQPQRNKIIDCPDFIPL